MPFGQKCGSYLNTGFGNVDNFLGNAYTTTKKTQGSLHSMLGDDKKMCGALPQHRTSATNRAGSWTEMVGVLHTPN